MAAAPNLQRKRSRSGQPAPKSAGLPTPKPGWRADPRYQQRVKQQTRDRRQQRKERSASLEEALAAMGIGPGPSGGMSGTISPPQIPLAPVEPNRYAGAEKTFSAQEADSRRYLAQQLRGKGPAATGSAGQTMGSYSQQMAQALAAYSAGAARTRGDIRARFATDELRRQGELSKARYERDIEQEKTNREASQLGNLSLSMIQALAAHGLDPSSFQGDPIGAAIALGRLQYLSGGAGQLTASQIAQLAELGLDYRQFGTSTEAAEAIGMARRGQYGGTNGAEAFLRMLQGL